MTLAYPPRLELAARPTPLQPLERWSAALAGPRIWLKRDDMTGSLCTGNKVRKLEFILAYALQNGYDRIITCGGLQSNHCRAAAVLAAQLGIACSLVLRGDRPHGSDGNLLLAELAGADVNCYPQQQYQTRLPQLLEQCRRQWADRGGKALVIPTGGSDALGIWGYIACAEELQRDFAGHAIKPAAIVHATGSGGTQAGLMLGNWLHGLETAVIGVNVCDDRAYFENKIRSDIESWRQQSGIEPDWRCLPVELFDDYVGEGYGHADQSVMQCIAELARVEGVILDPVYTGKAFAGLCQEIRQGRFDSDDDIVFVHTGGIFGLYPFREQIRKVLR